MNGKFHSPKKVNRWKGSQRRIGITGGIASGKSSIGEFLKNTKGLAIIDADIFARETLLPGGKITKIVIERYGDKVTNDRVSNMQSINRSALAQIIFSDTNEKLWLEQTIHPVVKEKIEEELKKFKELSTIILIIPLLYEAKLTHLCSEIWFVNCTKKQQLKRLVERDKCSIKEAMAKINSQWSMQIKRKLSDVIIDNSGEQRSWENQIINLLNNFID